MGGRLTTETTESTEKEKLLFMGGRLTTESGESTEKEKLLFMGGRLTTEITESTEKEGLVSGASAERGLAPLSTEDKQRRLRTSSPFPSS